MVCDVGQIEVGPLGEDLHPSCPARSSLGISGEDIVHGLRAVVRQRVTLHRNTKRLDLSLEGIGGLTVSLASWDPGHF